MKNNKKVKSTKKNNKKSSRIKIRWSSKITILTAVLLFSIFGAIALRVSRADSITISKDSSQVVLQYTKEVSSELDQTQPGVRTYISKPYDIILTGDGTLYCDSVAITKKGNIGRNQLIKVFNESQEISDLPEVNTTEENQVNNYEGIFLGSGDSVKRVLIFPDTTAPLEFKKVANSLTKLCDKATIEVDYKETDNLKRQFKESKDESAWSKFINKYIEGRAEAAYWSWYDENDQISRISAARASAGVKTVLRAECLTKAARNWAKVMADNGTIFHSNVGATVDKYCPNTWTKVGENVGMGSTSSGLFSAFMNSPGHKAIIIGSSYNRVGVGTYRAPNGKLFIAHLFANCGSNCAGSFNSAPSPVSAITGHIDSNMCTKISGWAMNQYTPTLAATVHIYISNLDGSGKVGYNYGATNIYRPDVNTAYSAYGATGNHGFSWTVPLTWQKKPHKITVYGIDNLLNPSIGTVSISCS